MTPPTAFSPNPWATADTATAVKTARLVYGTCEYRQDVAARAGVGKGAIYRRHATKDDLVMAAVAALVTEEIVVPDTGSTPVDLLALMRDAVELYRRSLSARLMPNLVGAMAERPELARIVITGGPIDEQLAEGVTDLILRGFAPDKPGRAKSKRTAKERS
jgi:AcrR family transcriptional regulator